MSSSSSARSNDQVVLGQLTSPHGVKGWLRVYSWTSPIEGILDYDYWLIEQQGECKRLRLVGGQRHGKGLIARLEGVDSREAAEQLASATILLETAELPRLEAGEYYWYQLEGLAVITLDGVALGRVEYLFETGANDVLVVRGEDRERLLPFVPDDVIRRVDLEAGQLVVDWDPEF
ncbi:ribosome maturation factor RimM [Kushneria aurantia]|uniref:Ribosome maturation factor RimM n=1 Tax=Kushneria aurantia TaxID=504092 RepID=A0ABV6G5C9_9GAMM|nr:ribosome maturation factor RimM [Kushneria aurantia]